MSLPAARASSSSPWLLQLLQTTNNSPMNSKPQQIKMQSTKKGPLSKREDGGLSGGPAVGVPPPGDEACSLGAAPSAASSSLQPMVSMCPGPPGWSWAPDQLRRAVGKVAGVWLSLWWRVTCRRAPGSLCPLPSLHIKMFLTTPSTELLSECELLIS